jgi:hypothetical protein
MAAYRANEADDLAAAEAALTAQVATEQALDNSLGAVTFTPQNRAAALALITNATSNGGSTVPAAAITFTPQITAVADQLVRASQALAGLTTEQARATTLTALRSFNHRVQAAAATVQADIKLLHNAVDAPLPTG